MIKMSAKLRGLMDELKTSRSETYYHSMNMKNIAAKMLKLMNADGVTDYTKEEIDAICKGVLLHDLGKLQVKNAVLTKDSSLTDEEMRDVRKHTVYSFDAVKDELDDSEYEIVKNICLYHHERIDGSGYEQKTDLPMYVQVVSICDVFSALYYDRSYREAMDYNAAITILEEGKSGRFDPKLIEYLKKATEEFSE